MIAVHGRRGSSLNLFGVQEVEGVMYGQFLYDSCNPSEIGEKREEI